MERKGQKKKNRAISYVVLGCVLFVACLCLFAGGYVYSSDKKDMDITGESGQELKLAKEAGAVETMENATRDFVNRPAVSVPGDNREVIRIVEVIPHEVCSIFPYLMEWGTKDEYDSHLPLGYEGLRYMASKSGLTQFSDQGMYSFIKGGITSDTLKNYDVTMIDENSWNGSPYWWRESKVNEVITANGYFEYVGSGKGLYSINLSRIIEKSDPNAGIRYRVMAMERLGNETPKGEWQVNQPAYYWAKNSGNTGYPTSDIEQITDYNYDLKFAVGVSQTGTDAEYTYRVKSVAVKLQEDTVDSNDYSYEAILQKGATWTAGYSFWDKGNYTVSSSSTTHVVTDSELEDLTKLSHLYIRVADNKKTDGIGSTAGYFRLLDPENDKNALKAGDVLYALVFEHVSPGQGQYVLNPAAVSKADKDGFLYEYVGDGKGTCDVTFIYATEGETLYQAELLKITDGKGAYALTSKAEKNQELYIEAESGKGDYSKVVTRIDCLGVDYDTYNEGWCGWDTFPYGLSMGKAQSNCDISGEKGGWVFHTVSSDTENGFTKIEEFQDGKIPNRIYVYNQNRKYRYYAQNGFKNNEWFKLLIYMSNDEGTQALAEDAYRAGKTGQEIVAMYREKLDEFDKAYRIEIIQRTPSALKVEDVNDADLIYISDQEGIYGLRNNWDDINTYLNGVLPKLPETLTFTDDFSGEVLRAIYDNCLYHEEGKTPTTALMVGNMANIWGNCLDGDFTKNNMGKLSYLIDIFTDPADFANFMSGYSQNTLHQNNGDGYSTVHSDASVTVYPNGINGNTYNQGTKNYEKYSPDLYGKEIEPVTNDQWDWHYFMVYKLVDQTTWIEVKFESQYSYKSLNGGFRADGVSAYKQNVQDGWTWFVPVTSGDNFVGYGKMHNIWSIMHQRTSKKSSTPKVIVTNPDYLKEPDITNAATEYYIYVDEYMASQPDAYVIDYKAIWTPEEATNPNNLISLTVERAEGGVIQSQSSPAYNTEYQCNVKGDFITDGKWNGTRMMHYLITATDVAGKSDTASVFVIFRDSFMLN